MSKAKLLEKGNHEQHLQEFLAAAADHPGVDQLKYDLMNALSAEFADMAGGFDAAIEKGIMGGLSYLVHRVVMKDFANEHSSDMTVFYNAEVDECLKAFKVNQETLKSGNIYDLPDTV